MCEVQIQKITTNYYIVYMKYKITWSPVKHRASYNT